ncbi:hypothetical protein SAMN04487948_104297 [Halogranum amylolyticum]|uniref:Uncharacterized protein n=1 Tax=Halogranum amylolyticum TaxID=660520 RepID=A0A1H8RXG2_9EURY|nr:hypothetical protein [Halogranum amylolyticum]SEO70976.1 hypothetical protein SAMN04487948_104297 [Halogranum amylolyticum]
MTEKKFTFLEIRLGDGDVQFGPKSISTGEDSGAGEESDESKTETELDEEAADSSGGTRLLPVVLGLLLLVVVAVAAKKFAFTASEDLEDLEELDEV